MTLMEISVAYTANVGAIRDRIRWLRHEADLAKDPAEARELEQRIAVLTPILRETRELAALTAHYYDRGCHKYERYTI